MAERLSDDELAEIEFWAKGRNLTRDRREWILQLVANLRQERDENERLRQLVWIWVHDIFPLGFGDVTEVVSAVADTYAQPDGVPPELCKLLEQVLSEKA